ncbi:MAG: thiol-activated cytolysin family protein [Prevotella sp.]|nr:thiol-activated cytolysin family protein [Prevotella sp.]
MRKITSIKHVINIITTIVVSCAISSCTTEEDDILFQNSNNQKKYTNKKSLFKEQEWDESYHCYESRSINNSFDFIPYGIKQPYPGMIFYGNSIDNPPFKPITMSKAGAITICFTTPGYYITTLQVPSLMYINSFREATSSDNFSGKQIEEFEYDLKQFSRYSEMKLAFGANVNIANILKIDVSANSDKIKHNTGLFARVCQKNFSVIMDYPEDGNIFANNDDITKYPDAVYINSITYGRMAVIAIESDSSYNAIKTAFKAALTAEKINGELSIDTNSKKILQEADITIYIKGGNGEDVVKTIGGFDEFKQFIVNGGTFSSEAPGVPIFISANYASDNSSFMTTFDTNQ